MAYKTDIPSLDASLASNMNDRNDSTTNDVISRAISSYGKSSRGYIDNETGWVSGFDFTQKEDGVEVSEGVARFQNYSTLTPKLEILTFQKMKIVRNNVLDFLCAYKDGVIRAEPILPPNARDCVVIGAIWWADEINILYKFDYVSTNAKEYEESANIGPVLRKNGGLKVAGVGNDNLSITSGRLYFSGVNAKNAPENPNASELINDESPIPFFLSYKNGTSYFLGARTVNLPIGIYDNGEGTPTSLPTGQVSTNSWCVNRLYIDGTLGLKTYQIGTASYSSEQEAISSAQNGIDGYEVSPIIAGTRMHAYIVLRGGGSNMASEEDCRIVPSPSIQTFV